MINFARLLLFAATLLLVGCLPESKNPIAPAVQTFHDPRLEGVWETAGENGGRTFYHMHWNADDHAPRLDIVGVDHTTKSGLSVGGYRALPAKIGTNTFLSFKATPLDEPKRYAANYNFARYDFTWHGHLRIRLASESAFAAAVKSRELRGTVKESKFGADVLITDSSEKIAAYVGRGNPDLLFDDKVMLLKRVRGR